jgi:acetoin utilization deacetylase AcuC-like enzyme
MGFCLFNNVAVAAGAALESGRDIQRVAIVDYDAHHGNGTQAAFLDDPRVALLDHQWGIYPGTGWYEEAPHARGRIVNVPLPARSGDAVFQHVADEIISPFLNGFRPDLLLVSAGFDAHWSDPLTTLGLSTAGFSMLSRRLVSWPATLPRSHCLRSGGRPDQPTLPMAPRLFLR